MIWRFCGAIIAAKNELLLILTIAFAGLIKARCFAFEGRKRDCLKDPHDLACPALAEEMYSFYKCLSTLIVLIAGN